MTYQHHDIRKSTQTTAPALRLEAQLWTHPQSPSLTVYLRKITTSYFFGGGGELHIVEA